MNSRHRYSGLAWLGLAWLGLAWLGNYNLKISKISNLSCIFKGV
ncbi:hypothetical protein [Neisseria sp. LACPHL-SPEC-2024-00856]